MEITRSLNYIKIKYYKHLDTNTILYADANEVELLFQSVCSKNQSYLGKDDFTYKCLSCLVK